MGTLFNSINVVFSIITFMIEDEKDKEKAFLYTLVMRASGGTPGVVVYRKPTNTDRLLHPQI